MVDWYHYGGIIRPVTVETLKGIVTLSERVEYELSPSLTELRARFVVELYNADDKTISDDVTASVSGVDFTENVTLSAGECKEIFTDYKNIPDFELWSQESPKLYEIRINTSTDDLTDRTGFRHVCVEDGKILLNGKEIFILGVNRHDEHPEFGFAFPQNLLRRDLDIAIDMGCNSIRGSHYPNNPVFVDMLDERGITFWSEIPIWGNGFSEETLADKVVLTRGEQMHREMVKHYYNHPSIIIWGMHNEIFTNAEAGLEMTKRYYPLLKEIGGNRLVVFASDKNLGDISFEYTDVICLNKYNGWYGGSIESWDGFIEKFRDFRDEMGLSDKPVIMSEFGGGAVYGHRSFEQFRWSEEYQAKLHEHCLNLFLNDPMIVGTYIWQFADIRTSREMGVSRARGYNNKGLLNEHRNPKAAYFTVKEIYNKKKSNA
jgi:beta-glucuronidase